MKYVAQTQRLGLRQFTSQDASHLLALNADPDIMRFISDGKTDTFEQAEASIKRILGYYEQWEALGIWAAELKSSQEFIGWFSLKPLAGFDEVEIGYRLLKRHWGQGYATEGAACMRDRGFREAGLDRIVAIVHPENAASRRVIEKTGLKFERRAEFTSPIDRVTRTVDLFAMARVK